jgi:hypothetical protein
MGGAPGTCSREEKCTDCRISVGKPEGEKGLHNLGIHVKIILQLILKEWMGGYRMGLSGSGPGKTVGCWEHGN